MITVANVRQFYLIYHEDKSGTFYFDPCGICTESAISTNQSVKGCYIVVYGVQLSCSYFGIVNTFLVSVVLWMRHSCLYLKNF